MKAPPLCAPVERIAPPPQTCGSGRCPVGAAPCGCVTRPGMWPRPCVSLCKQRGPPPRPRVIVRSYHAHGPVEGGCPATTRPALARLPGTYPRSGALPAGTWPRLRVAPGEQSGAPPRPWGIVRFHRAHSPVAVHRTNPRSCVTPREHMSPPLYIPWLTEAPATLYSRTFYACTTQSPAAAHPPASTIPAAVYPQRAQRPAAVYLARLQGTYPRSCAPPSEHMSPPLSIPWRTEGPAILFSRTFYACTTQSPAAAHPPEGTKPRNCVPPSGHKAPQLCTLHACKAHILAAVYPAASTCARRCISSGEH